MVLDPNATEPCSHPITIAAWQKQLRLWVLRTGVGRVSQLTGYSRAAVYTWIDRDRPRLPRVETCESLERLMGIRKSA